MFDSLWNQFQYVETLAEVLQRFKRQRNKSQKNRKLG